MKDIKSKSISKVEHLTLLSDKKSERTTLKLTKEAMSNLEWLKSHFSLSVKEILEAICSGITEEGEISSSEVYSIITYLKEDKDYAPRKTYVVSKGAVKKLTALSKSRNVSRDNMVSALINNLKISTAAARNDKKKIYTEVHKILTEFDAIAYSTCKKLNSVLKDDPFSDEIDLFFDISIGEHLANLFKQLNILQEN